MTYTVNNRGVSHGFIGELVPSGEFPWVVPYGQLLWYYSTLVDHGLARGLVHGLFNCLRNAQEWIVAN